MNHPPFFRNRKRWITVGGLLASSLWSANALAQLTPAPVGGGGNIGVSGAPGTWPTLATPAGHPFTASAGNPFAPQPGSLTELEVALGKACFWDEQLSTDNSTSCGTCHFTERGGVDPRAPGLETVVNGFGSLGVLPQDAAGSYTSTLPAPALNDERRTTPLMAPSMIGAAFASRLFWDGRAGPEFRDVTLAPTAVISGFATNAALEAQAVMPPINTREMGHDGINWGVGQIESKLNPARILDLATLSTVPPELAPFVAAGITYAAAFDIVFAGHPQFGGTVGVTRERFALVVASYERTLVPNQAPIDTGPLTTAASNGFQTLLGSQCFRCHSNQTTFFGNDIPVLTGTGGFVDPKDALMTDNFRHGAIGFPSLPGASGEGLGSFNVKTPTLRNTMLHLGWGHNGFFPNFQDWLLFYNRQHPSGAQPTFPFISPTGGPTTPLNATQLAEVVAFMNSLTDPRVANKLPPFDRPDLYAERTPHGSNEPAAYFGTPATPGGLVPNIIANVPLQNNDNQFQIGLRNAPPNAAAVIAISPNPLPVPAPPGPIMIDTTGMVTLTVFTDATGHAVFPFGAVTTVAPGQVFTAQWAVVDPASSNLAFSNAATFTVQ
jgi:cytochrome c peroxidase